MKSNGYNIFIALIVSIGGFLFGFDASVISGVNRFITPEFNLSDIELGWVVSSPSFSAMFAMLIAGPISDAIGRKPMLLIVAVLYAVSAYFSAYATSYEMLVAARMLGGAGFGSALILAPLYIAEIAPPEGRGKLVSIQQLNIVLGFSAAYFCNYYILGLLNVDGSGITETNVWRWMLGIEMVPAVLYFGLLFLVPRSPRWLMKMGRESEALNVLNKLHGEEHAQEEISAIKTNIAGASTESKLPLKALFQPALGLVLLIGFTVGILQQITGVNAIYFYAPTIFEQSGVGTNAAFAQAVWIGIINVVFTIVAMVLIDKVGRRPLLLAGIAGVAISMFIAAYGFHQATYTLTPDKIAELSEEIDQSQLEALLGVTYDNDVEFKNVLKSSLGQAIYAKYEGELIEAAITMNPILILIGILGFVASFAVSLGPVMWVLLSEIFPNWARALAISVIGFVNSLTSFLVQLIFPWELANWGSATALFLFGLFAAIGFVMFYRILPETKGKSLEELEAELVV